MAGFPELFIPLMLRGDVGFWHDFAFLTLPSGLARFLVTHSPPADNIVYIYMLGNTGTPRRMDTDEPIRSTLAFLEHEILPLASQSWPVLPHRDNLMESVYRPDYPLVTWSTLRYPMRLWFTNGEAFAVSWDITFWLLECTQETFDNAVVPYFKGYANFYEAFSDPEVVKGMAEFFKIFSSLRLREEIQGFFHRYGAPVRVA